MHRAREPQAEERLGGRYRPPALRALASGGSPPNEVSPSVTTPGDGSTLPPTNYPPGFRRARAGTLPSNVQLAAQRFAAASNTVGNTSASTESLIEQSQRQISATPTSSLATPVRPGLRHSTSVASSVASSAVTERNSRLRSGSLTLPTGGLSNAFGPSIFSSSWLSSTNGSNSGFPVLDELRSVTSADSGADDFDVHTLDYLGLDDSHRPPPAATISELRNQAQAAIAGNLAGNPSRLRASTVSNPYRSRPSASGSLLSTPTADEEEEYFDNYDDHSYHRQRLNSYETSVPDDSYASSPYVAKGFKQTDHLASTRPRAISVGNLDDPMRSLHRRAAAAEAHSYINELSHQPSGLTVVTSNIGSPAGILKTDKLATARSGATPTVHFPNGEIPGRISSYLAAPSSQNRSVSPKSEGPPSQVQTPTRSLWIGNLDSAVTSEQLIHVFAPYGAIESLRLLPEKVLTKILFCICS
jgi:protein JSN1